MIGLASVLAVGFGIGHLRAAEPPAFSKELVTCIENVLGSDRWQALREGRDDQAVLTPTEDEKAKVQECLDAHQPDLVKPSVEKVQPKKSDFGMKPELRACLEEKVPNFRIMFGRAERGEQIQPSAEQQAAAEACFASFGKPTFAGPPPGSGEAGDQRSDEAASKMYQCMSDLFGSERFAAMKAGRSQPSADEMRRAEETCFKQFGGSIRPPAETRGTDQQRSHGMSDEQQTCVTNIVGSARFEEMMNGTYLPGEEERRTLVEKCFRESRSGGVYVRSDSADDPRAYQAAEPPSQVKECLVKIFGEDALERMRSGNFRPEDDEMAEMNACLRSQYASEASSRFSNPDQFVPSENYPNSDQFSPPPSFPNSDQFRPTANSSSSDNGQPTDSPTPTTDYPTSSYSPGSPSAPASGDHAQIEACKQTALGSNYGAYQRGQYYPNQEEYTKMSACYAR